MQGGKHFASSSLDYKGHDLFSITNFVKKNRAIFFSLQMTGVGSFIVCQPAPLS